MRNLCVFNFTFWFVPHGFPYSIPYTVFKVPCTFSFVLLICRMFLYSLLYVYSVNCGDATVCIEFLCISSLHPRIYCLVSASSLFPHLHIFPLDLGFLLFPDVTYSLTQLSCNQAPLHKYYLFLPVFQCSSCVCLSLVLQSYSIFSLNLHTVDVLKPYRETYRSCGSIY